MVEVISKLYTPKFVVILLAIGVLALLLGCTPSHPQSTFDPAGPVAEKQRDLFLIIFWVAVFVFVLVEGVLLFALIRFRRKRGQDEIPVQTHGNMPLEIGWTIAPIIVLAVIAVPTIIYIFDIDRSPGPDALTVNVIGHQWWWEFEYPEQDLVNKHVITANEMHIPVNRQIGVTLRSDDVTHSFWIPKLAGKLDVIAQNENRMQFTATRTGTFFGLCAELCGEAHANMKFRVIVETQEEFDAWISNYHELAERPPPTGDTEEALGYTVFASKGCLLCHTSSGPASLEVRQSLMDAFYRGELRYPAPNLTNFGTRTTLASGFKDNDPDGNNLRAWLRDPNDVKRGNRMGELANVYVDPDSKLTEVEISALAVYLLSLK